MDDNSKIVLVAGMIALIVIVFALGSFSTRTASPTGQAYKASCRQVPYEEEVCSDVPYYEEECKQVPTQKLTCRDVPYTTEECHQEPYSYKVSGKDDPTYTYRCRWGKTPGTFLGDWNSAWAWVENFEERAGNFKVELWLTNENGVPYEKKSETKYITAKGKAEFRQDWKVGDVKTCYVTVTPPQKTVCENVIKYREQCDYQTVYEEQCEDVLKYRKECSKATKYKEVCS